ncbi:ribonuclease domain-containing protein [Streptomyces wedmorensis]|uniref:ribonuclease domain-containing protein n=1 Tax=Streptomyces wedmorensis TaxID=43759 RepID=UPI00342C9EF7
MILRCARAVLALLAGVSLLLTGCSGGEAAQAPRAGTAVSSAPASAAATPSETPTPSRAPASAATPSRASTLPVVRVADLPPEARETLRLIEQGGPFPYAKDGAVFGNFERVLPRRARGYYHEYTVRTPGERDRGARRIVTGRSGETYYTDDHYQSFREVVAP